MKNVFVATLALISFMGFNASAADEMNEIIACRPAVTYPDLGMSVVVSEGGFAGITEVTVTRFFLGHSTSSNYLVHAVPVKPHVYGAARTYVGDGIVLSANFTTAPQPDGSHYGTLQLQEDGQPASTTKLFCKIN